MGVKVILLVSMWVSVGGVSSTDHVASRISVKVQEKVQMTTTINSETKNFPQPASSTCLATRHGEKGAKAKHHLGKANKNGWFRATLQRGRGRYCSPPAGKDSIEVQSGDFPRATILRFNSSYPRHF
ncbi:hypothetical protein [Acidicapsa ligni]|uniref:hypothetical protein n=1 Tax=Acidicapsa ligni TaxID=542300 RepID=UPI0021DF8ACA|nr:hypothetical protein [Acidicapsa ligni]